MMEFHISQALVKSFKRTEARINGKRPWHALCLCESPAEEMLYNELIKRPRRFAQQIKIGRRRLDFLVVLDGLRINLEVDGREFHRYVDDLKRDSEILESGKIDWVVRIPAAFLFSRQDAVFSILNRWFPGLELSNSHRIDFEELEDSLVKVCCYETDAYYRQLFRNGRDVYFEMIRRARGAI